MISASTADHQPGSASLSIAIAAVVAHARDVPSEAREAFGDVLAALPASPDRFLIRTCHRVELYAVGRPAIEELSALEAPAGVTRYGDVDAVRHLIAVACGVDSAVFGETQVLHQLREAVEQRRGVAPLDPALDRLLQAGLRAGREARSLLTGPPRSLADAALDAILARRATGSESDEREILVVGAGRMGRLAALAIRRRGLALQVASRTPGRAAALASELGGVHVGFRGDADGTPPDGVIVALAGPWPVDDSAVDRLARAGTTLVDLSSPPALSATQRTRLGGAYVSVDALAATSEDQPDARLRLRLERVVSRVGADYCAWLRTREAVPAITALVNTAEARRSEELAWLRRRLPELTDEELAAVEQMSHRLVAAMLHAPLTALTRDDDGELEPAARTLFGV